MPERVCNKCTNQVIWGCDGVDTGKVDELGFPIWKNPAQMPLEIDGAELWSCPRRNIKDEPDYWGKVLFHFGLFKRGHLTDDGNIASQSFKALQIFGVIEDTLMECNEEKQNRQKAKANRK